MQWCNEKVMEFLEVYQTEPCLWDPRQKSYKNRGAQNDAWLRIAQQLRFPFTIDELKKKKESLMGYYRIHLNKYKKSLKTSAAASDVYTTNWFAFDVMHSFLKPIYDVNSTGNSELSNSQNLEIVSESEVSEGQENSCHSESSVNVPNVITSQHQGLPKVLKRPSNTQFSYSSPEQQHYSPTKKQRKEVSTSTKQINESFHNSKPLTSHTAQGLDEYDHFAIMIAAKIRKINDLYERESVMNAIQNLVFHSIMKGKNATSCTISMHNANSCKPGSCWTSNHEAEIDVDTKNNIPLYLMTSNTPRSCSSSPGSDQSNVLDTK